jgi:hypothetical protein
MATRTTTLPQFQEYVWELLPHQRSMLGREAVFDAINVAIQEWPDELLCGCKSGDTAELKADDATHTLNAL